ncbi:hypothetical protein I6F26_26605 [Ensifer sp. IC3342]|nr:hypothetical protein [Ensifer sp. BRP08]MCA1450132.1 hypothetical protein [Ensifer sp. IC3342]
MSRTFDMWMSRQNLRRKGPDVWLLTVGQLGALRTGALSPDDRLGRVVPALAGGIGQYVGTDAIAGDFHV